MNGSLSNINIYTVYTIHINIHMHIWIAFAYLPHVSSTLLPKNLYCSLTLVVSYYYDFLYVFIRPPLLSWEKSVSNNFFSRYFLCVWIYFRLQLIGILSRENWKMIEGKRSRNQECNFNMMLKFCYWFNEFHFFSEIWCLSQFDFNMKFFTFHRILVLVNITIGTKMLVRFLFFITRFVSCVYFSERYEISFRN